MGAKSTFKGVVWGALGLLLLAHAGGGWFFSGELIEDGFTPDPDRVVLEASDDFELQDVTYSSPLGEFDSWHLPGQRSTWVIHVHGKGATPAEAQHLFGPIQEAGYPQLAITYRNDAGQPADPTGYYQYGSTEWEDVQSAVEFAQANGARDIVLNGFSTGASHILAFLYRNNLDVIKGLIFDSPNIDFGETVDFNAAQRDMPLLPINVPSTIAQVAKFFTSLRIGVNWKSIDYVEKADDSLRVPVLIHHGTSDQSVPVTQSIEFAQKNPEVVRLIEVPEAGHVGSYEADPEGYLSNILQFLAEVG